MDTDNSEMERTIVEIAANAAIDGMAFFHVFY